LRENSNQIDLSDEDTDVVKTYVRWLYHKGALKALEDHIRSSASKHEDALQVFAANLHIFGEKILDESFSKDVLGCIKRTFEILCGPAAGILYLETPENSAARKFVTKYFEQQRPKILRRLANEWPHEILKDMPALFPLNQERPKPLIAQMHEYLKRKAPLYDRLYPTSLIHA